MKTQNVKIGNWQVCCNEMAGALIGDDIIATDPAVEELRLFLNADIADALVYCPWCGEKLVASPHPTGGETE